MTAVSPGSRAEFGKLIDTIRVAGRPIVPNNESVAFESRDWGIQVPVDESIFPEPELIRVALVLIGCKQVGRSEKTAWEVFFDFEDHSYVLAYRKFGLRLGLLRSQSPADFDLNDSATRIIAALSRLVARAEKDVILPWIKAEGNDARFALRNNAPSLKRTYQYFRTTAADCFAGNGRMAKELEHRPDNQTGGNRARLLVDALTGDYSRSVAVVREGGYNTSAMVNAYFSYLEHFLTLALPFVAMPDQTIDLKRFLGNTWAEKFRTIFELDNYRQAKIVYDGLKEIAETYRNPLAHGGYDKRGPSLRINLETVGWIPLKTTGFENSIAFGLHPVEAPDFNAIVDELDRCDRLLVAEPVARAADWIADANDVYFHPEERASYHLTSEEYALFVARREHEMERSANMDW